jgi:predicted dithiol-disulfide oxidoreductase (DUF899 family)
MENHEVVPPDAWLEARKRLLVQEKEFTRLRDQLSRQRRELPWERVEKDYAFDGPQGTMSLADLFAGKRQLLTYHFMFLSGTRGARTARSGRTTSTRPSCTCASGT